MLTGSLPEVIDHRKLASDHAKLDGSIPVASFKRLSELVENDQGEISVKLQFRKGKKHRTLCVGKAAGVVTLICQNCLDPVTVEVDASIRMLLVQTFDELMALAQDEDGLVCEDDKVALVELIEDDLIVILPMVPRHSSCGESETRVETEEVDQSPGLPEGTETYRPFAGLRQELNKE